MHDDAIAHRSPLLLDSQALTHEGRGTLAFLPELGGRPLCRRSHRFPLSQARTKHYMNLAPREDTSLT